jgi:beta-galactosidase/beta-glucuronidase
MGFNGARKHQKVEDPRWLYWADRLGFLVWGEMANAYQYSPDYVRRITSEWQEAVRRDYNHPCVVAWVPMNESWGVRELATDPGRSSTCWPCTTSRARSTARGRWCRTTGGSTR